METKTCSKCGIEKPLTKEYFFTRKDTKDGFRNDCKSCRNTNAKVYYQDNKETLIKNMGKYKKQHEREIADYQKQYFEDNKDSLERYYKKYCEDNKNNIVKQTKQYRETNKDMLAKKKKAYFEINKESLLIYAKQYRDSNLETIANYKRQYAKDYPEKKTYQQSN